VKPCLASSPASDAFSGCRLVRSFSDKERAIIRKLLLVFAILIIALPSAAQVAIADWCYEVDHSGDNPFGSPSMVRLYITVSPEFTGSTMTVEADGASGPISGTGVVGPDGLVEVEMPLYSYGSHSVTSIETSGTAFETSGLEFTVDASEPECDPSTLALSTTTTTTTVVETTTTVVETTTTVAETTTTSASTTTSEATTTTVPVGGTATSTGWWLAGGGLALILIGIGVVRAHGPCRPQLLAWLAAQQDCDAARRALEEARRRCEKAKAEVERLEEERKNLCKEWPPACWDTDDGGWIEESGKPESRITQRDLHMRSMALGDLWDRYRAGEVSAQEVEEEWKRADTPEFREEMRERDQAAKAKLEEIDGALDAAKDAAKEACDQVAEAEQRADEACKKAAEAKKAYDDCIGASKSDSSDGPPPEPPQEPGGTTPQPPTGPPGIAEGPGTTPPPSGTDEEEEETSCCPEGRWIGYGWTTGGILGFGVESTIVHFVCLCDTTKYITLASRSLRAGLALGGETGVFAAFMWGVTHVSGVPVVWANKSGGGWDGDVSLGPSVTKGLKNVVKSAPKAAVDYLKWAAKNKVDPTDLDPRKLDNLRKALPDAQSVAQGAGRAAAGQGLSPQLIVVPFGAGLQVGLWHKWCESVRVGNYQSCGCTPVSWP